MGNGCICKCTKKLIQLHGYFGGISLWCCWIILCYRQLFLIFYLWHFLETPLFQQNKNITSFMCQSNLHCIHIWTSLLPLLDFEKSAATVEVLDCIYFHLIHFISPWTNRRDVCRRHSVAHNCVCDLFLPRSTNHTPPLACKASPSRTKYLVSSILVTFLFPISGM